MMKNKLIGMVFVGALFVSGSVCAESDATPSTGWLSSASSAVSKVVSAPADLHKAWPKITGLALLAAVAVIAYKIGTAEVETKSQQEDLL